MLDNICSLPLSSDIFTQAIHPKSPLLAVGLSSGHVETFKLPSVDQALDSGTPSHANGTIHNKGRRLSENGFDMVDSAWRTRRHKGSCRSLAYSLDGETLFSTGTDGLVKAAETESGKVTAKIALHNSSTPSVLCSLSPQALLLGTDTGSVYLYDLREPSIAPSTKPSQAFRPHDTPEEQLSESINSLTPLPPTAASTSGTCRSWVSTCGSTLGVTDLRKGVVTVSEDQGDMLLSSTCLSGSTSINGVDRVAVGGFAGNLTVWNRGQWEDRSLTVNLGTKQTIFSDDQEVEQITTVPSGVRLANKDSGPDTVAAGISNGTITFVKILPKGGHSIGHITHDDRGVDGITTLGFDVAGRMISGGGQLVKIWHEKFILGDDETNAQTFEDALESDEAAGSDDKSSSESDSSQDQKQPRRKRRKRKQNRANESHGNHGIMAFQGMD